MLLGVAKSPLVVGKRISSPQFWSNKRSWISVNCSSHHSHRYKLKTYLPTSSTSDGRRSSRARSSLSPLPPTEEEVRERKDNNDAIKNNGGGSLMSNSFSSNIANAVMYMLGGALIATTFFFTASLAVLGSIENDFLVDNTKGTDITTTNSSVITSRARVLDKIGTISLKYQEAGIMNLFKRNTPSVVFITNVASRRDAVTMHSFDVPQGAGSGIIWDNNGHVVTNFHVVRDATEVRVSLGNGSEYHSKLVGADVDRDIAVLQVNPDDLKNGQPISLGTSADIQVGQKVFAIGNPFGLDHTLTTGIISGIGREIANGNTGRPIQDVIQTDAAINPGNSGGPLLDSSGNLIGINTAIYSPSGANSGVGFAIPVDAVRTSVEQILKFGRVLRPMIGITFAPDLSTQQLGLSGILVLDAKENSPAARAGIVGTTHDELGRVVLGDLIVSVDGKEIQNASDLFRILDKKTVGDSLDVEVLRGGVVKHVPITLESSSTAALQ